MQKDSANTNNKGRERKILQRDGGSRSGNNNNFRRGDERGHDAAELRVNSRSVVIESVKGIDKSNFLFMP